MRITTGMMSSQVVFNMQRSLRRFMDMQTSMSSGRRINKPSDDPLGTLRDLSYRTELAKIAQFRKNISQGLSWTTTYDSTMADMKNFVSTAKEIAVAMANGNYDNVAREASAKEVQSIFEQMIQLGNGELEGRRIFAGFRTKIKPFQAAGNGAVYNGDQGEIQFEIESSLRMTINVNGSDVLLQQLSILGEESDLNVGVTGTTLLADLHVGNGIDLGTFSITDRNADFLPVSIVDLSGATTVNDAINTINAQLVADGITNLTASLGAEGNNIMLEATDNGLISNSTLLNNLNSGYGVHLDPGKIRVTDGAAIDVLIDLSGTQTVGDIITEFNAQLAAAGVANVTMSINATDTGLVIDDTNGVPLGLSISDVEETCPTATDLGIVGNVNPTLAGQNLNPKAFFEVAEVAGTTADDLGILGEFSSVRVGDDLDPALVVTALLADLKNGLGLQGGSITVRHGELTHAIDLDDPALVTIQDFLDAFNNSGLIITASINASGRGIQVSNDDSTRSLVIEESAGDRAAKELGLFGSSDVLGSLVVLRNALQADDQEGTGMLLKNLEDGIQHLLGHRATVGARAIRLETADRRLVGMDLNFTALLSEVEDADMAELVTDLAMFESNYHASLLAAAKIIQPSLMDFLTR